MIVYAYVIFMIFLINYFIFNLLKYLSKIDKDSVYFNKKKPKSFSHLSCKIVFISLVNFLNCQKIQTNPLYFDFVSFLYNLS